MEDDGYDDDVSQGYDGSVISGGYERADDLQEEDVSVGTLVVLYKVLQQKLHLKPTHPP